MLSCPMRVVTAPQIIGTVVPVVSRFYEYPDDLHDYTALNNHINDRGNCIRSHNSSTCNNINYLNAKCGMYLSSPYYCGGAGQRRRPAAAALHQRPAHCSSLVWHPSTKPLLAFDPVTAEANPAVPCYICLQPSWGTFHVNPSDAYYCYNDSSKDYKMIPTPKRGHTPAKMRPPRSQPLPHGERLSRRVAAAGVTNQQQPGASVRKSSAPHRLSTASSNSQDTAAVHQGVVLPLTTSRRARSLYRRPPPTFRRGDRNCVEHPNDIRPIREPAPPAWPPPSCGVREHKDNPAWDIATEVFLRSLRNYPTPERQRTQDRIIANRRAESSPTGSRLNTLVHHQKNAAKMYLDEQHRRALQQ
eukprot:Lankesteria_metandrocarpae@DN957_c0_g1_i2.p1